MAEVISFGDLASVAPTTFKALGHRSLNGSTIIIRGTFVGTAQIEISDDNTNWVIARDPAGALLSGITAGRSIVIAGNAPFVRVNCTAYTSGTIISRLIT